MQLKEEKRDLFSVNNEKDMWYVQCISADFACGKGIALEFNKRGDVKNLLMKNYKKICGTAMDIVFQLVLYRRQMKIENISKYSIW